MDKIMGLTIGADDYITKPFNPLEVAARVKTQLRRYMCYNNSGSRHAEEIPEYDIRGLVINREEHRCQLYGEELSLTPTEFSVLWYLCEHQGVVVPAVPENPSIVLKKVQKKVKKRLAFFQGL